MLNTLYILHLEYVTCIFYFKMSYFGSLFIQTNINPFHAEFLKWNNPPSIYDTVHYHFKGYQDGNLKSVSQQYRAWSECTDVQSGLALYWWQRHFRCWQDKG